MRQTVKSLTCRDCGVGFSHIGKSPCSRCLSCREDAGRRRSREFRVRKGLIRNPGVGSGGNQWGEDNHQWLGGKSEWTKYKGAYRLRCLKRYENKCCIAGCTTAEKRVQVHHIDGDSQNYLDENLIPLCHRHHWFIHHKKKMTVEQLKTRLAILMDSRSKIAENTEEVSTEITRPEGESQGQRIGSEIISPRSRDI